MGMCIDEDEWGDCDDGESLISNNQDSPSPRQEGDFVSGSITRGCSMQSMTSVGLDESDIEIGIFNQQEDITLHLSLWR